MGHSQTVSFAASGFLVTGGLFATVRAHEINKRNIPGALRFNFLTWFMWPFWIPLSVYVLEPADSPRRPLFLAMSLGGLGTLHLIYIILRNNCARECPVLLA